MNTETAIQTVMLIDDEEVDQILYKRILIRSKYVKDIVSFQYAEEALAFLKQENRPAIDVIFLDINMPRMDGFEFIEAAIVELGKGFTKAVIVMLTTSLDPKDQERAARLDVVKKFISKPLTIEHVQSVVQILKDNEPL